MLHVRNLMKSVFALLFCIFAVAVAAAYANQVQADSHDQHKEIGRKVEGDSRSREIGRKFYDPSAPSESSMAPMRSQASPLLGSASGLFPAAVPMRPLHPDYVEEGF